MKKHIKIKIADNLTPEEEGAEIGYALYKNAIPENKQILIGDSPVGIKELTTHIVIERVSKEKPIEFVSCPVCNQEYQNNLFKKVFTNYGGITKSIKTCSIECANSLIELCDGRASLKRKELVPVNNFFRRQI